MDLYSKAVAHGRFVHEVVPKRGLSLSDYCVFAMKYFKDTDRFNPQDTPPTLRGKNAEFAVPKKKIWK